MIEVRQSHLVMASKEAVAAGFVNAEILRTSIPGCSALRHVSGNLFWGEANVGFMRMRFDFDAALEITPTSEGYNVTGPIRAGSVTAGRIDADIRLSQEGPRTRILSVTKLYPQRRHGTVVLRAGKAVANKLLNLFFDRFTVALRRHRLAS